MNENKIKVGVEEFIIPSKKTRASLSSFLRDKQEFLNLRSAFTIVSSNGKDFL